MQQIITAKLKLTPTQEQCEALRQTQLVYRDALNAVSRYAFEQGKTSNVTRPTITHDYANACSKKALVARNAV